jgi:hypothetical protein
MELSVSFIEGLMASAIVGLVGWVWFLHGQLVKVQLDLAKNYHSKEELRQVVTDAMFPVQQELARLSRAIERLQDERE